VSRGCPWARYCAAPLVLTESLAAGRRIIAGVEAFRLRSVFLSRRAVGLIADWRSRYSCAPRWPRQLGVIICKLTRGPRQREVPSENIGGRYRKASMQPTQCGMIESSAGAAATYTVLNKEAVPIARPEGSPLAHSLQQQASYSFGGRIPPSWRMKCQPGQLSARPVAVFFQLSPVVGQVRSHPSGRGLCVRAVGASDPKGKPVQGAHLRGERPRRALTDQRRPKLAGPSQASPDCRKPSDSTAN